MNIPRNEYPRPQFARPDWLCLNGTWEFEIDPGDSGRQRGLLERPLAGEIVVPFCPESELSGVGNTDFLNAVWYRRRVDIPAEWTGQTVLLHFQAADYDTTVWVNGREVGRHRGGWTPFSCELADVAAPGETCEVVVRCRDLKGKPKPGGKQSLRYQNHGCHYTRTTGIWQTVWMEPVPPSRLERPRILPDGAAGAFRIDAPVVGPTAGLGIRAVVSDDAGEVTRVETPADADFTPHLDLAIPEDRRRLWTLDDPFLYDLRLELLAPNGDVIDAAASYAGLRSVTVDGNAVKLNGRALFQRLVLDQGYYPDGILTAPSDEALRRDIELSLAMGFNGARLHQKLFEERFLYHADRLGYLVWGEFGDWGLGEARPPTLVAQWLEAVKRDASHPCVVGWCPLNETHDRRGEDEITELDDLTRALVLATKAADPTRPVLDASGYCHRVAAADIYDSHDYEQDPDAFVRRHAAAADARPFVNDSDTIHNLPYRGQPYFVSEFGGIWWNEELARAAAEGKDRGDSWGYGDRPADIEAFYRRFEGLCDALLDNPGMFGYCYTQLTDVFQEQNGLYTFDRQPKFDVARLRAVQQRPAAIEA